MTRSKRLLLGFAGTFIFLLIMAVIVVKIVFTKARILALLTPQIERVIDRPVSIADASITIWSGIGVRLEGLSVGNAPGFSNEPMVSVGILDIKAQFWPLLSGKVVIDRIVLDEPYALVEYNSDGQSNFNNLVKADAATDSAPATEGQQRLTVGLLIINDARLSLRDQRSGRWVDLYGADSETELDAADPLVSKFATTIVFDSLLMLQEDRMFAVRAGKPSIFADGSWNKSSRTLTIDTSAVEWWGAKLTSAGQVRFMPSLYEIGFNSRLGSVKVEELIRDIDSAIPLPKFKDLKAFMSGNIEARLVWPLPEHSVPDWQGRFELVDVKWPLPQSGALVTIPRVEIRGSDRSISWSAPGGQITGGTFSTSGTIDQLFVGEETFSARLQANMPLEGTKGLLPEAWRSSVAGALDLDVSGFGSVDRWRDIHVNGRVYSDRLVVTDADWDFDSISISMDCRLTGHGAQLTRCNWIAGDSRGALTGKIENILPAMLSDFTTPDIPHGEFALICPYLNLDRIIGDDDGSGTGTSGSDVAASDDFPLLSLTGEVSADTMIYNGMTISAVTSPFTYRDRVFSLSPISGQVYGGSLGGRLDWNLSFWPRPEFFTSLSADGIEANDFFSRYLGWAGGVFGRIMVSGEFSGQGRTAEQILPTLLAQGKIDLSQARLESAPLLAQIASAVGLSGLDRPRNLKDLRLPFRVENGRIITDEIRVTWDDVSYTGRGSFGLDQTLSYSVRAKSISERAPGFVQGTGLKFSVSGTVTSPSVAIDAAGSAHDALDNAAQRVTDTLQKTLDQKLKDFFQPRKP
jgi:hypothetical protein